jgi:hypothetical protein
LDPYLKYKITWKQLTGTDGLKSIDQLTRDLNTEITDECYSLLAKGFRNAVNKFHKAEGKTTHLAKIFGPQNKKKGSKQFRRFFELSEPVLKKCPASSYCAIAGTNVGNVQVKDMINGLWSKNYFGSDLRTFVFKLHGNTLGLNSRIHHINAEREPTCTFCQKAKIFPCMRETFEHFFWYCPQTASIIKTFSDRYLTAELTKELFFTGISEHVADEGFFVVATVLKYILWQFKLRKKLPSWPAVESELNYTLGIIMGSSKKLKGKILNCELFRHNRDE